MGAMEGVESSSSEVEVVAKAVRPAVNDRVLIGDNLRKSAVKYLLFVCSPVVRCPAFAAYC